MSQSWNWIFSNELKFDMTQKCFKKCISGMEEKPLSPYERECFFVCLENQGITAIELHNNFLKFEEINQK